MIARPPILRRVRGFTLIEVLLAVAVFAIVLGAINTVFFAALRLRNKVSDAYEAALPVQQAIGIIKRDLAGIMVPAGQFSGALQTTPTTVDNTSGATVVAGLRVSPDIYTCTGLVDDTSPFAEVQKVAYYLADPTNNTAGKDLIRSITRNLLPARSEQPVEQWLMSGVESMAFLYFDGTTWADTWDSVATTNLPMAIKVQISRATEQKNISTLAPIEFIVPIMVQVRTNSASSTTTSGGSQ